jgi:hypothetical protein
MSDEETKRIFQAAAKAAIREWLDEQFAQVGRWTVRGIIVAALGLLAYLTLTKGGWQPPHP